MDTTKSNAPYARPTTEEQRLARLEEKYRHDLLPEDARCELRDRTLRLRRKLCARRSL